MRNKVVVVVVVESGKKKLRIQKYPDACGLGLRKDDDDDDDDSGFENAK